MQILNIHFNFFELITLILSFFLIFSGIFIHEYSKKIKFGIIFVVLGGLGLRLLFCLMNNFFNLWDEQYHALVAKHLMENPLKPVLFKNPAIPYYYPDWGANHIWLHKQPLFIWQISLSFELFGISPFTMRIPSIVLSTLLIILVYDISKKIFNPSIAIMSSALIAGNSFFIKLVSGSIPTDHNDVAFVFYVAASIWAWVNYTGSNKTKWLFIVGIFAGFAVLNKWLLGLLVYLIWGMSIFLTGKWKSLDSYKKFFFTLILTALISLPWQFYIHWAFPRESSWELNYNALHFFQVIEGHGGDFWYHFDKLKAIYGNLSFWILPFSFLITLLDKKNSNRYLIYSLWIAVTFVLLFFSLAKTKMQAFTMIVFPILVIFISHSIYNLISFIYGIIKPRLFLSSQKILILALFIVIFFKNFNYNDMEENYTNKNIDVHNKRIHWNNFYNISKHLGEILKNEDYVIFNYPRFQNIQCMILTNYTVYDYMPEPWHYFFIQKNARKLAVLDFNDLPDFIIKASDITKIKMKKNIETNLYSIDSIYN